MRGPEMKVSVVLPTYNERENICELIGKILELVDGVEIVVVDDNSPDMTWKVVEEMKNPNVKVIRRRGGCSLPKSISEGIKASSGEIVAWMDADMGMPPSLLPELVSALKNADIAVGSRYAPGGMDDRNLSRVVLSKMLNWFASCVLGYKIKDYDSGFVAVKKHVFGKVRFPAVGPKYGEYCIEFLYRSAKNGFRVVEVPYVFTERKRGKSKTMLSVFSLPLHGIGYGCQIIKTKFSRG